RRPTPPISPLFPYTTLFRSRREPSGFRARFALPKTRRERRRDAGLPADCHAFPPCAFFVGCPALGHRINQRLSRGADARLCRPSDRKSTRLNSSHVSISYAV